MRNIISEIKTLNVFLGKHDFYEQSVMKMILRPNLKLQLTAYDLHDVVRAKNY